MIRFIKKDYRSVKCAIQLLSNGRIPNWVILLYYIIVAPFGFILYPFVKIWSIIYLRSIRRKIERA